MSKPLMARGPLERITRVHEELEKGRFPNCRKLAEALETSCKTIQRDIDFMRDRLNLPIVYDPQRFGFYYESTNARKRHMPFPWLHRALM